MIDKAIRSVHTNAITIIDSEAFDGEGNLILMDWPRINAETLRLTALQLILDQIDLLESSIDTSRMRREYAEGMRKKLEGLSPTPDELWAINKVQDVDNQIGVLRSKLNV